MSIPVIANRRRLEERAATDANAGELAGMGKAQDRPLGDAKQFRCQCDREEGLEAGCRRADAICCLRMTHTDSEPRHDDAVAELSGPTNRPTITVSARAITFADHFFSMRLLDGFVVPVDFSATVWDHPKLACKVTFVFEARRGASVVIERRERAKDGRDEVPASKGKRPDRLLERMMLATAATPADRPLRSLFGQSYDVVFPLLAKHRDARRSTRDLAEFARRYRQESTRNTNMDRLARDLHMDGKTMREWRRQAQRIGELERKLLPLGTRAITIRLQDGIDGSGKWWDAAGDFARELKKGEELELSEPDSMYQAFVLPFVDVVKITSTGT